MVNVHNLQGVEPLLGQPRCGPLAAGRMRRLARARESARVGGACLVGLVRGLVVYSSHDADCSEIKRIGNTRKTSTLSR